MMENSHSRGSAKKQRRLKPPLRGKTGREVLRLRESGQNLADSMAFFSMSALDRMQR
jgi:hypothetical protein